MPILSSILDKVVSLIEYGQLTVVDPSGAKHEYKGKFHGPKAEVRFLDPKAYRLIALRGSLGFAEGYIKGFWTTTNLDDLLQIAAMNIGSSSKLTKFLPSPKKTIDHLKHRLRFNSVEHAKHNVQAHYDIGNDFYKLWLDESQTYSCAIFEAENNNCTVNFNPDKSISLTAAQHRKYQRLLEMADTQPGMRLLDIGCGWGGLAIEAAKMGCTVVGITLSEEQKRGAEEKVKQLGLDKQITIELKDYRHMKGKFDRIISIGMYEHVGHQYWQQYFDKIHELLKDDGKAVVHGITIREDLYPNKIEFLTQYIFPGGELAPPSVIAAKAASAGLETTADRFIGLHYAETLSRWSENFEKKVDQVKHLGLDDEFIRTWRYYMSYARAGFITGRINVIQAAFVPKNENRK